MATFSTSTAASQRRSRPDRVVVMGVSGSGKTTVGRLLASALGGTFIEGDDLHTTESVEKMRHGVPLQDEDRWPWFDRIIVRMTSGHDSSDALVVGCSALKRSYRDKLRNGISGVMFLFLDETPDVIRRRVSARQGHYMPATLVDSQFQTLERPEGEDDVLTVSAEQSPEEIVAAFLAWSERS